MEPNVRVLANDAPRVWTVPAGADFLTVLAETLAEESELATRPDALADALIYVPNRRSARVLIGKLHAAAGGGVIIPPEVRALGDLESDEAPPGAEAALAGLGPAMPQAERIGTLARLVQSFYRQTGNDVPPASAIAAARELSALLDQAALSDDVIWERLPELVVDANLAGHWEQSVKFLEIITQQWPEYLREENAMDPLARRMAAAEAMVAQWRSAPPSAPVIIAGSTGATPASRALMLGALGLPMGRVVLPGLDMEAGPASWEAISETVSHPQHKLAWTLTAFGLTAGDVAVWPGPGAARARTARRRMIHEALAPAEATADWTMRLDEMAKAEGVELPKFAAGALAGLTVIEAGDEGEEAEIAALLMRGVLETPGETAALVTPDAGLARRISALLKRWGVNVPPSGGVPLGRTKTGSLIGLVAAWSLDPGDPVALVGVLKHPFVRWRDGMASLETHFLRGARRWQTLDELAENIQRRNENKSRHDRFDDIDVEASLKLVGALRKAVATHVFWDEAYAEISGPDICIAIASLAAAVANTPRPWAGEDGDAASKLMESIAVITGRLGPISPRAVVDLIHTESAAMTVSDEAPEHPQLSIWGPLEARLQSADRVILAGLNEDVWPQRPSADAFLPRRFRSDLGLIDPEDRLGLAAHDFAQLAAAPDVTMLYAARRDDAPAVASRWVWRLKTLARGAHAEAALNPPETADPRKWVRALRAQGRNALPNDFAKPAPSPQITPRLPRLSATRIDTLQRDPYAIYASEILRLSALDPLDADVAANVRGTAVHAALEDFEADGQAKSAEALMDLLQYRLKEAGEPEEAWAGRRAIWAKTVDWYLQWRDARKDNVARLHLEKKGYWEMEISGQPFTLSAIADRIERGHDGKLSIVDFKTGSPPTDKMIATGFEQQMPLQAVMAQNGAFEGVAAGDVESLVYVAFKAKPSVRDVNTGDRKTPHTVAEIAAVAEEGLKQLIAAYRESDAVFSSTPRPQFAGYGSYDLLARRAEWTSDILEAGDGDS